MADVEGPGRGAVRAFVALGVALRVAAYLSDFPLWWDEALLGVNLLRRGYLDLLRPLDGGQVAPLLFLWAELTAVKLLGFSEWSTRLVPLICGVASVPLFARLAGRVAPGRAGLIALGVFAVSVHPIRHSADLKPYSADLLMALILQLLALGWLAEPGRSRRLWRLAAFAPVALLASHTAILVAGGLGLALIWPVWKTRRLGVGSAYVAYGLVVVMVYAGVYVLMTGGQASSAAPGMRAMWARSFPPLDSVVALARWAWVANSGDMLAYPCGGEHGGSALSLVLAMAGAAVLIRRGEGSVLAVLVGPLAMGFGAAALRLYPYGGPAPHGSAARVMQYAAPGLCLLIGLGADRVLGWLRPASRRRRAWIAGLVVLVGVGVVTVGERFRRPFRAYHAAASRDFARRFWTKVGEGAEVVDLRWDLAVAPWDSVELGTAVMLCDEAIYSPARRRGGPDWAAVSGSRPLRCVLGVATDRDRAALGRWLGSMERHYTLRHHETITIETAEPGPGRPPSPERYEVFEFVPRGEVGQSASGA